MAAIRLQSARLDVMTDVLLSSRDRFDLLNSVVGLDRLVLSLVVAVDDWKSFDFCPPWLGVSPIHKGSW